MENYIDNANSIGRHEADDLELLREKFPYFQTLHILLAKCHKNQNTFGFNKNLKLASLYAGDRKVLYNFINSDAIESGNSRKEDLDFENKSHEASTLSNDVPALSEGTTSSSEPSHVDEPIKVKSNEIIEAVFTETEANSPELEILIQTSSDNVKETKPPIFEVVDKTRKEETLVEPEAIIDEEIENLKPIEILESSIETDVIAEIAMTPDEVKISSDVFEKDRIENPDDVEEETVAIIETDEITSLESNLTDDLPISLIEIPPIEVIEPEVKEEEIIIDAIEETPEILVTDMVEETPEPLHDLTPAIEVNQLDSLEHKKEEPSDDTLDFTSWLDNFKLETSPVPTNSIEKNESDKIEKVLINPFEHLTQDTTQADELQEKGEIPIEIISEVEEGDYDPVAWAEIAYDIQAFVKVPEVKEEKKFPLKKADKKEIDDLLDKFINKNPSISRPKVELYKPENMAKKSEEFHAEVVSETLANLFYKQKHLHKALEMYEKLILQNPDKKETFAARIKSIKEELINQL